MSYALVRCLETGKRRRIVAKSFERLVRKMNGWVERSENALSYVFTFHSA